MRHHLEQRHHANMPKNHLQFRLCCAVTSTAMVFKYYGASSLTPRSLNNCLGTKACPIYWQYAADNCDDCWNTLNAGAYYVGKYSFAYTTLASALNSGRPPLLELYKSSTNGYHWVVVRKVYGDGTQASHYTINDPANGSVRPLTDYTNNGYSGNSIVVYGKSYCV